MTTAVVCLLLTVATLAQGVKISPKMVKGMKKNYQMETVIKVAGKEFKMTAKQNVEVVDKLADGYLLRCTLSDFSSNVGDDNVAGLLVAMGMQMTNGINTMLKTNADGKVLAIQNFDEMKQKAVDMCDVLLNRFFEKMPEAAQMVPREELLAQLTGQLTEENFINSMQSASSVTALNGKTIATGSQESFTSEQGLKMQRTYFLTKKDGSALTSTARMNMTKDELKQMIIAQLEKTMPDQAEMIKQNIDMMIGQMAFDATEKATYEMGADGWVSSLTVENSTDAMGQKTNSTTTVKLAQ